MLVKLDSVSRWCHIQGDFASALLLYFVVDTPKPFGNEVRPSPLLHKLVLHCSVAIVQCGLQVVPRHATASRLLGGGGALDQEPAHVVRIHTELRLPRASQRHGRYGKPCMMPWTCPVSVTSNKTRVSVDCTIL